MQKDITLPLTVLISVFWGGYVAAAPMEPFSEAAKDLTVKEMNFEQDSQEPAVMPEAKAVAVIQGTSPESTVEGTVNLMELEEGLKIEAELHGVPPGMHGFHIHEKGSCDDGGKAAGGHYNPVSTEHGFLAEHGFEHAHAGDLGNVNIDENGDGQVSIFLQGLGLTSGEHQVAGLAVILHEKEDDGGQPTGNAGGRIGCGIIELK